MKTDKKIGIAGYNVATGIGSLTRFLWRRIPFTKFMIVQHGGLGYGPMERVPTYSSNKTGGKTVALDGRERIPMDDPCDVGVAEQFLSGLDAVLCVERTWPASLFDQAKARGARTVLVVMREWIDLNAPYFKAADVLLAPTLQCFNTLKEYGQEARTIYVPCPIDANEFTYRHRTKVDNVCFFNGYGGCNYRKGIEVIAKVLENHRGLIQVYSQSDVSTMLPQGTEWRKEVATSADLYKNCDLAVQPSLYEGVGLSILEAMASGIPVITTDAEPMSQFVRAAYDDLAEPMLTAIEKSKVVTNWGREFTANYSDRYHLADQIKRAKLVCVSEYSRRGREYVEGVHGEAAFAAVLEVMTGDLK